MVNARTRQTAAAETATPARYDELKQMLEARKREMLAEVQDKIHEVRAEGYKTHAVLDDAESSEVDSQEAIEFALIEMKAETLSKIDEALSRLERGTYGHCFECGGEIAEARLRALPFAVRCKDCEEARETAQLRHRARQRREAAPLMFTIE